MKLATIPNGKRDGQLVVVSRDLKRMLPAPEVCNTLQNALENWELAGTQLATAYGWLNTELGEGIPFDPAQALAPLPRAYQWLDGSVYLNHAILMSAAFGLDAKIHTESPRPLMYQGGSDSFVGAQADLCFLDENDGIDFEAEIGVITSEVPMGVTRAQAAKCIRLVVLLNDVSLRRLAPIEMKTGFGWVQAKPSSSFAPVAVTLESLGDLWRDNKLHADVQVHWNGKLFGRPACAEMAFDFAQLVAHAAGTRSLCAGTIIGAGTVSNLDYAKVGSACITERRAIEQLAHGAPSTPFMKNGDRVRIEVVAPDGESVFGAIDQKVRIVPRPSS